MSTIRKLCIDYLDQQLENIIRGGLRPPAFAVNTWDLAYQIEWHDSNFIPLEDLEAIRDHFIERNYFSEIRTVKNIEWIIVSMEDIPTAKL
jgi:hypothetical protein